MLPHPVTVVDSGPNGFILFGSIVLYIVGLVLLGVAVARNRRSSETSIGGFEKRQKRISLIFSIYWMFGAPFLIIWTLLVLDVID